MKINDKAELIKGIKSRNRLVFPPMDTLMANDGKANSFHIAHYVGAAYGGFGNIIVESTAVSKEGRIREKDLGLWKDDQIESFKEMILEVKRAGSNIGVQLNHAGSKAEVDNAIGLTSFYVKTHNIPSKIIDLKTLKRIMDDFINASKRAKEAGFNFVELHAAHGYLLSEMIHPQLNEVIKSDSIMERTSMLVELIKKISKIIPVGIRISAADGVESNFKTSDFKEFIQAIDKFVEYIHVSGGETLNGPDEKMFNLQREQGENLPFLPHTKEIREMTKTNIIAVNRYRSREDVLRGLKNNFDFIAIGRFALFNRSIVLTDILNKDEIDNDYHWNNNIWWNPVIHAKRYKK